MLKQIHSIKDRRNHRRIARTNPLRRISGEVVIGMDVYHSTPSPARPARTAQASSDLFASVGSRS